MILRQFITPKTGTFASDGVKRDPLLSSFCFFFLMPRPCALISGRLIAACYPPLSVKGPLVGWADAFAAGGEVRYVSLTHPALAVRCRYRKNLPWNFDRRTVDS